MDAHIGDLNRQFLRYIWTAGKFKYLSSAEKDGDKCWMRVDSDEFVEVVKEFNSLSINNMSNIAQFAEDRARSKEDKLLIRHGLMNEHGNYTHEAKDIINEKLFMENRKYLINLAEKIGEEDKK